MRDLKNNAAVVQLLAPQDIEAADTTTMALDTAGYNGALVAVEVGAITGVAVDNYLVPVLQESDTIVAADFEAVAAADMVGAFTKIDDAAEDVVVQQVGYIGEKRYIRVNLDFTCTAEPITACPVSVIGVLGYPGTAPINVTGKAVTPTS